MPDSTLSTLTQIRTKVRRITKSPSTNQLTDAAIDAYINTFVLYDFPGSVKLFYLSTTETFYTKKYVNSYSITNSVDEDASLKNLDINFNSPIYIDGLQAFFTLSRSEWYSLFPKNVLIRSVGTGDASTVNFSGTLGGESAATRYFTGFSSDVSGDVSGTYVRDYVVGDQFTIGDETFTVSALGTPATLDTDGSATTHTLNTTTGAFVFVGSNASEYLYFYPLSSAAITGKTVLPNDVTFTSVGADYATLVVKDDGVGSFTGDVVAGGTIDYVTGIYDFTFDAAPASGEYVYSHYVPYTPSRSTSIYYDGQSFLFNPVPDDAYKVELSVNARPSELLVTDQMPELSQWWQYISLGASRKVFQDRAEFDNLALIEPEFEKQELLVLRRTLLQQSQQQVATIYNTGRRWGWNSWNSDNPE